MDYLHALESLYPTAEWIVEEDRYETLQWFSEDIPKPTEAEINAKIEELKAEQPLKILREKRNKLLVESDWSQFRDVSLPNDAEWTTYRQALRDLPANTEDPANPVWPTKPS